MLFRHEYRGGVWIDLEQPTQDEIRSVAHECGLSERLEAELLSPTPSALVAGDAHAALLVLHFPAYGQKNGDTKKQEIDFVVGARFVITVRYEVIAPLHNLKKLLETQELVAGHTPITTDVLLEILFAHLYTSVHDHSNRVADSLDRVEKAMFAGHDRSTISAVSDVSREYLHLEAALANQEESLTRFLKALSQRDFFGASFRERTDRILAERSQVARLVTTHRAVASELRETNTALVNARQNEIMKTLTVITFILMPLQFIALVFHLEVPGTPLIHRPDAFWIIIGIMTAVAVLMIFISAKKRWLS